MPAVEMSCEIDLHRQARRVSQIETGASLRRIFSIRLFAFLVFIVALSTASSHAHATTTIAQEQPSLTDAYPWVHELVIAILAVAMIAALIYFLRPEKAGVGSSDFRIVVEGSDVQFKGRFPATLESMVEEFLLEDCQIPGRYEIRGTWQEGNLAIEVYGDNAQFQEQRIRNFLKLHVKRPA
jgi:hypothetical protein